MKRLMAAWFSLASVCFVAGCDSVTCGPGTHEERGLCVPDAVDASVSDGGPPTDAEGRDASADAGPTDGATADSGPACTPIASPASDPGTVSCEDTVCEDGTVCTIDIFGPSGSCHEPGMVPSGEPVRECDEAADCAEGTLCCFRFLYSGPWAGTTTTCEGACEYGAQTQLCKTDGECETGACRGWSVAGGDIDIATCQAPIGC